jgi:hypothetical protein
MCENNKKQEDLMEPYNNTTNGKKYKHLNVFERYKIEVYLQVKKSVKEIAILLNRNRSTRHCITILMPAYSQILPMRTFGRNETGKKEDTAL